MTKDPTPQDQDDCRCRALYEPKRRASALAIYSFGIPLGSMLGAVIGGQLLDHFTWRAAFMVVGLPGVAVAIAIKLLIKEPPRGHSEPVAQPQRAEEQIIVILAPAPSEL